LVYQQFYNKRTGHYLLRIVQVRGGHWPLHLEWLHSNNYSLSKHSDIQLASFLELKYMKCNSLPVEWKIYSIYGRMIFTDTNLLQGLRLIFDCFFGNHQSSVIVQPFTLSWLGTTYSYLLFSVTTNIFIRGNYKMSLAILRRNYIFSNLFFIHLTQQCDWAQVN
jgi:hypothetical protein